MDCRTRYLNQLRGEPVDRLPFLETAKFNMAMAYREDWRKAVRDEAEILDRFGFDNAGPSRASEAVPVDWYAVPRYEERELPSEDGYYRVIDGRYGRVLKAIPADPPRVPFRNRIFEGHVISSPSDWREVRTHFRPTTEGRFPEEWEAWCEHSHEAGYPIVLEIRDIAANIHNLMGEELFLISFFEIPDLVREMVKELSELTLLCIDKALREARVDMVSVGSDVSAVIGPNVIRDYFLESEAKHIELAKSLGIDLVCIHGRGRILPVIEVFRSIGANGINYVMETGGTDFLDTLLNRYGDDFFVIGAIDGRVLLDDFPAIEREVDSKIALAREHRIIPTLHLTHLLPDIPCINYGHYAEYLRQAIFEGTA